MSSAGKTASDSKPTPDEKAQAKQDAFLVRDYELKIAYLTNHFTRMWTRFNYFVAIETTLVGSKLFSECLRESRFSQSVTY